MSYSICLMQHHNTDKYDEFLGIVNKYFCCCWRLILIDKLQIKPERVNGGDGNNVKSDKDKSIDTKDISVKQNHSVVVNMEMTETTMI